jgi:aspartyl protease family protein
MRHAHPMRQILLGVSLTLCACAAGAQSVAMTGGMGRKALLVINGGQPKALAAGEAHQGVKVISVTPDQTVVEIAGQRQTVALGGAPVSVGARSGGSGGTQIVLTAGSGGHFVTQGSINGRSTQFVVDTGATMVSMGSAEAKRLGIHFENGQRMQAHTANGVTTGYRISLGTVRIQDVEVHNVEAAVMPMGMPYILLGNSFLSRFQMKQENGTMTLQRRF